MNTELNTLIKDLKEWQSQEVKERFERANSMLHLVTISQIKLKIRKLKRGEDF